MTVGKMPSRKWSFLERLLHLSGDAAAVSLAAGLELVA
jgi:hypothetical protein